MAIPQPPLWTTLLAGRAQNMVESGWCRNNVNRSLSRIKMLFKWAVSQELLPGPVYHALLAVPGFGEDAVMPVKQSR